MDSMTLLCEEGEYSAKVEAGFAWKKSNVTEDMSWDVPKIRKD